MALILRGTPTNFSTGTAVASAACNVPTGTTTGDLMFAFVVVRTGTITTPPAGWNLIASKGGTAETYWVYWKFGTGAEPASYTWTASTTVRWAIEIVSYQAGTGDWDTTNPIDVFSNVNYVTSDTNIQSASVTPTVAGSYVFNFAGFYSSAATISATPPTGFALVGTVVGTTTTRCQLAISNKLQTGATGLINHTISAATTTKHGIAVVLAPPAGATVVTDATTAINYTTATLNGTISSAASAVTEHGFCWSSVNTTPTLADSFDAKGATTPPVSYSSNITGLTSNVTYYVRAYATTSNGVSYGSTVSFTTLDATPSLTTTAATSITLSSASTGGNVTDIGLSAVTERGICWSQTSAAPTIDDNKVIGPGTGLGSFVVNLTGLSHTTTYYVRAYAISSYGVSYGNLIQFLTLSPPASFTGVNIDCANVTSGNRLCSTANASFFSNCTFSGGGGHAIRLTAAGTFDFRGNTFTKFGGNGSLGAAILNDSGGLITLNILDGGSSPTYKNVGASTTVVNNSRTLLITGLIAGSRVAVISINGTSDNYDDDTEVAGTSNSDTTFQYNYNWTGVATIVNIKVIHPTKGLVEFNNISLGANGVELPVQSTTDRQYGNPV